MFSEYCGPTDGLLMVTVWFGSLMVAVGTRLVNAGRPNDVDQLACARSRSVKS